MSNTLLCWPDETLNSAVTFSGGSWLSTLPLTNLQNHLLSKVCQSTNATSEYTQFVNTYSAAINVDVIHIPNHNISLAGTIRVRGYSNSGLTTLVYDTGTQYVWPQTFTATMVTEWPNNWTFVLPTRQTARYWKVEIVDTTNPAGFILLGRCVLGTISLNPNVGIPEGAELGYESRTTVVESLGGVPWYNRMALPRRCFIGTFPRLTATEKQKALIMQKTMDTSGELLFVRNKNDNATDMLLNAFLCVPRKVSPLSLAYLSASEMAVEFAENVA